MKERGKQAVEVDVNNNDMYFQDYSTSSSDLPCRKHPLASSVGICAYCLKDRLLNLVCSDCGEQRLSSCSCSEISSNRNSCTVDVGSVGRISFLIENGQKSEGSGSHSNPKPKSRGVKAEDNDLFLLKRSSSSCVEIDKRKNGFWRIGRLFSKRREKGSGEKSGTVCGGGGFEEKNSDLWVVDYIGVSRSRSLCSFRNGGFFGSEDGTFSGARSSMSAARSSISAARNSGVNAGGGLMFDPDRKSGFSDAEPRKSGFEGEKKEVNFSVLEQENTRRVFSLKEGNFSTLDDSSFIDLKFDLPSSDSKAADISSNSAFGSMRGGELLASHQEYQFGDGVFPNGGSCRITVSERGIKRSRKSFKSWRWIFGHHIPSSAKKKEQEDLKWSNT